MELAKLLIIKTETNKNVLFSMQTGLSEAQVTSYSDTAHGNRSN